MTAWRTILESEDIFGTITAFQGGYSQSILSLNRLVKPVFHVPCDEWFTVWAEENHHVLKPWLDQCDTTKLCTLFERLPRLREIVVIEAVVSGRLTLLEYLHSVLNLHTVYERLLDIAARFGQLGILKFLQSVEHAGCSKQAIDEAATHGHLEVVEWLFENREDGFTLQAWYGASKNGHIAILDCLQTHQEMEYTADIHNELRQKFSLSASEWAGIDILKWFRANRPKDFEVADGPLVEAVATGDMDAILNLTQNNALLIRRYFKTAIVYGHLDDAKRTEFHERGIMTNICLRVMPLVAKNGHLEVIKWWVHQPVEQLETEKLLMAALNASQWHVSDWLLNNLPQFRIEQFCTLLRPIPFSKFGRASPMFQKIVLQDMPIKSAVVAARLGNLEALRLHPIESLTARVAEQASFGGHLRLLKYLHESGLHCDSLLPATYSGRLNVVKFLFENRLSMRNLYFLRQYDLLVRHTEIMIYLAKSLKANDDLQVSQAVTSGQLDLFHHMLSNLDNFWWCGPKVWQSICARGDLQFAQYVMNHNVRLLYSPYCPEVFVSIPILRFLVKQSLPRTDNQSYLLKQAASTGYLPAVQFLLDKFQDSYTPRAMYTAAGRGHLEVVKYLHAKQPEAYTTEAIVEASTNGHLDVVKWLYENSHDGSVDEALVEAAQEDHLHVVQWLVERHGSEWHLEGFLWMGPKVRAYFAKYRFFGSSEAVSKSQESPLGSGRASFTATEEIPEAETIVSISGMKWYTNISSEELRWQTYSKKDTPRGIRSAHDIPPYRSSILQVLPQQSRRYIQAISAMETYEDKSTEEIRWEDYSFRATLSPKESSVKDG
ncbi:hypothetical protein Ae201684P_009513 [Aphanomyces euteiches]|uniref:Uncharacterized protein n=1 Tax=Aphanomyces euteiches TaxID=100861 RepID=A0A6G0WL68_9STRA|nr:hypothetical protein Ae201684_014127 [Aphanomyces euteiches]KAH9096279.1 hypothetical protein Ae201684P_009513 [Aphanomyces euteiches]KAH9145001.1 hypothetical protein AeRB84_011061 [Aphanomyces euteiches]